MIDQLQIENELRDKTAYDQQILKEELQHADQQILNEEKQNADQFSQIIDDLQACPTQFNLSSFKTCKTE